MGKHRCICRSEVCRREGGEASVRVPKDPETREKWRQSLFGSGEYTFRTDPRVSLVHFPHSSLLADATCSEPDGSSVSVKVRPDTLPNQSEAAMEKDSVGALGRSLRWRALAERHQGSAFRLKVALVAAQGKNKTKDARIAELLAKLKAERQDKKASVEAVTARARKRVDYTILNGKTETEARALCGLSGAESLQVNGTLWG